MKKKFFHLCFVIAVCSCFAKPALFSVAYAKDNRVANLVNYSRTNQSEVNNTTDSPPSSCVDYGNSMRISVRHIESGGVGYNDGYTTLEAFIGPPTGLWSVFPFLDVRGHVFNDGNLAANAGLGIRTKLGGRIYGINTYYDYRNTDRCHYNQIALGLETLGKWWDIRLNGYLPVGDKKSSPYHRQFSRFVNNNLLISRRYEFAMKGLNAEAGVHYSQIKDFDFYGAAGPYYFNGSLGKHAWGGEVRVVGKYKNWLSLELRDSFDNVFHNNFQGQIGFSLSFGPKSFKRNSKTSTAQNCYNPPIIDQRLVQPVDRQEIVVLNKHRKESVAINPLTGAPYTFWFVNNLSQSAGTFESPFHQLIDAQNASSPYDVIYVFRGNGTTTGLGGIVLQNGQKLLGAGIEHVITTSAGTITIPALDTGNPKLTNSLTNYGVVAANNNEIAGFDFGANRAILAQNISNISIHDNTIRTIANFTQGITLDSASGQINIYNNVFNLAHEASAMSINVNSMFPQNGTYLIENNRFISSPALNCAGIQWGDIQNFNTITVRNNYFFEVGDSAAGGGAALGIFSAANGFQGNGRVEIYQNVFDQCTYGSPSAGTVFIPVQSTGSITSKILNNMFINTANPATTISVTVQNAAATSASCVTLTGNTSDSTGTAYLLDNTPVGTFIGNVGNNIGTVQQINVTPGSCP